MTPPTNQQLPAEPLKALVVDDDPIARLTLQKRLVQLDYQVSSAANGYEALSRIAEVAPDIVITDWMMPVMDGLELCREIRRCRLCTHCYIIMLTSCETAEELVEAFDAGADDYVVKPFSPKVLEARLRSCVRIIRQQKKIEHSVNIIRRYAEQLAAANSELHQLAMVDVLTELPNRRQFLETVSRLWIKMEDGKGSLCAMMVDIDHFKLVNDNFGHDVGDWALSKVAERLKQSLRDDDFFCRLGGEEFLLLCCDDDRARLWDVAERLRLTIASDPFRFGDHTMVITISLGVAIKTDEMVHYRQLIKAADQALFTSKELGRNRTTLAK